MRSASCLSEAPSRPVMHRLPVRLDIGAMLYHRDWYTRSRPAFRYLAYDASPKQGTELFGCVERAVLAKDLRGMEDGGVYDVIARQLPLCQLGHLRLSTADKAATLTHQAWLDYGPEIESVWAANSDVRSCLSGMGAELGVPDMADSSVVALAGHLAS